MNEEITNEKIKEEYNFCITMISVQQGRLNIDDICKKCFEKVLAGNIEHINTNEYKLKFFDGTSMMVCVLENEKITSKLNKMINYYEKINLENSTLKENILRQISLCNSIVCFEFYKDENENRNNIIASILFSVAKESAGLLILPNFSIYSHEMKLLISSRGATEYTEYHPIARRDTSITLEKMADKFDKERIKSNVAHIKSLNLPCYEKMTNIPLDKNTALNEMIVIINNLILSYTMATLASKLQGKKDYKVYDKIYNKLNELYQIEKIISDDISKVLKELREGEYANWKALTWEYEYVAIFLWVLSIIDFPNQETQYDIELLDKILLNIENTENLVNNMKMRAKSEVLQKTDLLTRYKWALDENKIKNLKIETILNSDVVEAQLMALDFVLAGKRNFVDELIRKRKTDEYGEKEFIKELINNFSKIELFKATEFVFVDENAKEPSLRDVCAQYNDKFVLPIFSKENLMAECINKTEHLCVQLSLDELVNSNKDLVIDMGTDSELFINTSTLKNIYQKI